MNIELLDYTIRAGMSRQTAACGVAEYGDLAFGLAGAGIEHVELGYLADNEDWLCSPLPDRIEGYYPLTTGRSADYSVMIHPSGYDVGRLPECSGKIRRVRFLLKPGEEAAALALMKAAADKGYEVICDIEKICEYSDQRLLRLLEKLNAVRPDQVTIVDNTRRMDGRPVEKAALLLDHNLPIETRIGLRSGGNNGMASFIAGSFLETPMKSARTAVLEGTLLGIGLIRNNLCTECMADRLNEEYGTDYDYERLIALISIFIPEANRDPGDLGGYHPVYYLTARNQVDGDYGRYFLLRGVMLYKVNDLLRQVAKAHRYERFDAAVAEEIYLRNRDVIVGK